MSLVGVNSAPLASLPVRGAWIEMRKVRRLKIVLFSRSPCGERGLKSEYAKNCNRTCAVAPRAGSVD